MNCPTGWRNYFSWFLELETLEIVENTQNCWDCSNSKYRHESAGHIATGDLNVIKDHRIGNLTSKGPI